MSEKIIVLGNGESRKNFQLTTVKHPIIGCNAAYRDIGLNSLVCCDKKMVKEVLSTSLDLKIYTRKEWVSHFRDPRVQTLPEIPFQGQERKDQPIHWNSGPYAILLACTSSAQDIFLFGFDLYGNNGLVNNLYKDSLNYKNSTDKAVDPSYWIYQIGRLFNYYQNKNFIVINNKNWSVPETWKLPNVFFDNFVDNKYLSSIIVQ